MLQKIQQLISQIHLHREKTKDSHHDPPQKRYSKKWNNQEETLLCDLIIRFGTDFGLIQEYFPQKSRKQIKKKYRYLQEHRKHMLVKMEHEVQRERRKSFFDEEILEQGRQDSLCPSPDPQQQSF